MRAQGAAPEGSLVATSGRDEIDGIERILHPPRRPRILVCANTWCGSHFEQCHPADRFCSECMRWARIIEFHLRCREMQP